jgi:hypothetical protein
MHIPVVHTLDLPSVPPAPLPSPWQVDVPPQFAFVPRPILQGAGNTAVQATLNLILVRQTTVHGLFVMCTAHSVSARSSSVAARSMFMHIAVVGPMPLTLLDVHVEAHPNFEHKLRGVSHAPPTVRGERSRRSWRCLRLTSAAGLWSGRGGARWCQASASCGHWLPSLRRRGWRPDCESVTVCGQLWVSLCFTWPIDCCIALLGTASFCL